jgi:uncharacterized SAM-binding protein YcdF (DUF218 family)
MKRVLRVGLVLLVLLLAWPAWLAYQVWDQSHEDELHSADAIVVLGAAQYNGEPSPVFKARLDHAAFLYEENFSETVIVTGGAQEGDRFTEAEAGHMYLTEQDIPSDHIVTETEGRTTLQSLRNVKRIAEEQGIETVLLVSDPLHSERVKRIATDLGFEETYASWASYVNLHRSWATKSKELLHEVASLMAYELLDR